MEPSLFQFIWTHSKRQQIVLLLVTIALFPFLYLTLELPKRIINDAIGAGASRVEYFGVTFTQVGFLALLCGLFLASVLAHGLLKMRINTLKGVLAERMLRRLRYILVTRLFRFPKPYFQRTSQAEIVSMVTSEAEPLGGMMGDALSQPVMQLGQMATILAFLFFQSFWFGLAAVSMIPLQAWLIPKLQKQVNLLNKKRLKELRKLAGEIGETAVGSTTLRTSLGYRYRASLITDQLGHLFFIRLSIYKKKFFMKFLNNFLGQLTPFFFFSIGGYLVILGNVSIGALVAALAAYKDLSSPWKELLTYYTRAHEMAQRWTLITDHFSPSGTLDKELITGHPDPLKRLDGDIVFDDVTAHDSDGLAVVKNLSITFPKGGLIAIAARNEEDRRAIAELLTRELLPSSGTITVGGDVLSSIHQDVIGARIGWADSNPFLFAGTIRDNLLMALRSGPSPRQEDTDELAQSRLEAEKSGNSHDLPADRWVEPSLAELDNIEDVYALWLLMIEVIGVDRDVLRRGMALETDHDEEPVFTQEIVDARAGVMAHLDSLDLAKHVVQFDPKTYNRSAPFLQNILFATLRKPVTQKELAERDDFVPFLEAKGLSDDVFDVAHALSDALFATFGNDGTDHPLFQRIGIDVKTYNETLKINTKAVKQGKDSLTKTEMALLLAFPCLIRPQHIGKFVPDALQDKIVALRTAATDDQPLPMGDIFEPLDSGTYANGLSLLQNSLFGMIDRDAGKRADDVEDAVIDYLVDQGLKAQIVGLTLKEPTALGGTNLPRKLVEKIGFIRAAIKRPDIYVLNSVLSSYDPETRINASIRLRQEMPNATLIYLEDEFVRPENFDVHIEISKGQLISGSGHQTGAATEDPEETDLAAKLQALEQTEFFADLDRNQMRLLAFSARSFEKSAGETVFEMNDDPSDGAYLMLEGEADFVLPIDGKPDRHIRTLGPGALVGELALILGEPRSLTMKARTDIRGLRIGGEDFLTVIKNDPQVAFKMLQVVTRYLSKVPSSSD